MRWIRENRSKTLPKRYRKHRFGNSADRVTSEVNYRNVIKKRSKKSRAPTRSEDWSDRVTDEVNYKKWIQKKFWKRGGGAQDFKRGQKRSANGPGRGHLRKTVLKTIPTWGWKRSRFVSSEMIGFPSWASCRILKFCQPKCVEPFSGPERFWSSNVGTGKVENLKRCRNWGDLKPWEKEEYI